jgi:hypothetical protein
MPAVINANALVPVRDAVCACDDVMFCVQALPDASASSGVVIVSAWADRLFAFECASCGDEGASSEHAHRVMREFVELEVASACADDDELMCLLGVHPLLEYAHVSWRVRDVCSAQLSLLLPPAPSLPQLPAGNDTLRIADASSSSSSSSSSSVGEFETRAPPVLLAMSIMTALLSTVTAGMTLICLPARAQ